MKLTHSTFAQRAIAATLSAGSVSFYIPAAIADAPGLTINDYTLNSKTVQECVSFAEDVMRQEGLQNIEVTPNDVFGATNNTSAEMYCLDDAKTLIMVTTGLDDTERMEVFKALEKRLVSRPSVSEFGS